MGQSIDSRFNKFSRWVQKDGLVTLVHLSAAFLFIRLIWFILAGKFLIDPIRQTTTHTGRLAITFLFLSLSCTPANIITGWSRIIRVRKPLGLYAFGFAMIHGLTYVVWDYGFNLPLILSNLQYERYVLVGGSAFLVLLILAITSLRTLQKRMDRVWTYIQRLVYVAGGLAVLHVLWLRKIPGESLPLVLILVALLLIRVPWLKSVIIKLRQSITKGMNPT